MASKRLPRIFVLNEGGLRSRDEPLLRLHVLFSHHSSFSPQTCCARAAGVCVRVCACVSRQMQAASHCRACVAPAYFAETLSGSRTREASSSAAAAVRAKPLLLQHHLEFHTGPLILSTQPLSGTLLQTAVTPTVTPV